MLSHRLALALCASVVCLAARAAEVPPNIVIIYADDLGYGDVGCYGATAVKTPNIDRLAREGLRFTDAHATSATCTPSRFSLMTGRYAFRQEGTGILPGDAKLIIAPGTVTLPSVLQGAGYRTGVVGKWHLGLGPEGGPDWNGEIKPSPLEIGFNDSFIMAATGDRVPCVYVENHRVFGLDPRDPITVSYKAKVGQEPTGAEHPELLKFPYSHGHNETIVNGISRIGFMTGGKAAWWKDEEMADTFTRHAVSFIEANPDRPFFLYFAPHDIHVPRVPNPRFVGQTTMGPRGDVIVQLDWAVGQVVETLDRLHLTEKTLIIFSSDNGPVIDDGYQDGAVVKLGAHLPAGPLRGGKYSIYEGGTRVPFIVHWPGRVKPGESPALLGHQDLVATLAALTQQALPAGAAPDSLNLLPALLGDRPEGREQLVEYANGVALRDGAWKYIPPQKSGRRNAVALSMPPKPNAPPREDDPVAEARANAEASSAAGQMFDLTTDLGETNNLIALEAERARRMAGRLQQLRAEPDPQGKP